MKLGPRDTRQFFDSTYFSIFTLQNFLKDTVFKEHLWVNVCVRINFNVFSFLNKMCIYTAKKKLWSSRKIGLNQRGPLLEIMLIDLGTILFLLFCGYCIFKQHVIMLFTVLFFLFTFFSHLFFGSGAITKLKKSVGWTIDKFRLNNSRVINGTILRFSYRKIEVQRSTFANFWDFYCS